MAKKRKLPKHLRLSMLRPKLGTLLNTETLLEMEDATLRRELDTLFKGLDPEAFLPVLVKTACDAMPEVQARLNNTIPKWIEDQDYSEPLLKVAEQRSLNAAEKRCIEEWLERSGIPQHELEKIEKNPDLFYKAYTHTDEFGSQGFIIVIWYTDQRKRRATGFQFLIDHNPPWEGALKDNITLPKRRTEDLVRRMVNFWEERGVSPVEINPAEAKRDILVALEHNREEKIRLPKDLIPYRDLFIEQILSLPDTPETPEFTPEDFDKLSKTGKTPESINLFERAVGRRIRTDDGEEIFVMRTPFDEDLW
jgi:hypothetical protein